MTNNINVKGHWRCRVSTFCFVFISLLIVGITSTHAEEILTSRMRPMLGTYVEITVDGLSKEKAYRAIEEAFEAIAEVDRLLSSHRPESELNAINEAAGREAIQVSPWTYECIAAAIDLGEESQGAFDITSRPVLELWGFVQKKYYFPTEIELKRALTLVNYRNVILLRNKVADRTFSPHRSSSEIFRVGLEHPKMQLDVGGIGKGFAVDKAVDALKRLGVRAGLVRAGGDLYGFGSRKWKVGISDPLDPQKMVMTVEIQNEAISTSGNYRNFFEHNNRRYSHIIDPRSGWPVPRRQSLSVRGPTCTLTDGWSTALFVNSKLRPPLFLHVLDVR
jgi:FAD:protein FMN transferase